MEFPSIKQASDLLGTSRKTIGSVINYVDTYVSCSLIHEPCRFFEVDMPAKYGSPYISPCSGLLASLMLGAP